MEDLDLILKDLSQKSQVSKVKKTAARPVSSVGDISDLDNLMKDLANTPAKRGSQIPNSPSNKSGLPPITSSPPNYSNNSLSPASIQTPPIAGSTISPPIGGRERRNTSVEELDSIMNAMNSTTISPIVAPSLAVTGAVAPTSPDPDKKPPKVIMASPSGISGGGTGNIKSPTAKPGGKAENELDALLNNITHEMESLGVNTESSKVCGGCGKIIVGSCMRALGKQFHPEHFTCTHCKVQLGTLPYFEKDGYPYCEDHYHLLFSPRCVYCDKPITDRCLTALGHMWHPEHFLCAVCEKPLTEASTYYEKEGKAYCETDFYQAYAPKCRSCNQSIVGDTVNAINTTWHPEHFVCQTCRNPFGPKGFFEVEGLPYCDKHYNDVKGQTCSGCGKPITGKAVSALSKKYHPEHFVCAYCMKKLDENSFSAQSNKPYCQPCHSKLFS